MRKYSGTTDSRETERERRNRRIAREAAAEAILEKKEALLEK